MVTMVSWKQHNKVEQKEKEGKQQTNQPTKQTNNQTNQQPNKQANKPNKPNKQTKQTSKQNRIKEEQNTTQTRQLGKRRRVRTFMMQHLLAAAEPEIAFAPLCSSVSHLEYQRKEERKEVGHHGKAEGKVANQTHMVVPRRVCPLPPSQANTQDTGSFKENVRISSAIARVVRFSSFSSLGAMLRFKSQSTLRGAMLNTSCKKYKNNKWGMGQTTKSRPSRKEAARERERERERESERGRRR